MPLRVGSPGLFLDREVNVQPAGIEPHAASSSKRLGLGNLAQPKMSRVKGASDVLAALGQADVDM
jgi:hypothetical protein